MNEPHTDTKEAVTSIEVSAQLLIAVTRRLFIALIILFGLSLTAAALLTESIYIVPLLVFASGVIGGFVGLQRRLKDLTLFDLELIAASWVYTGLSPLVGGVLAFLLFILFLSGLISGDLFPFFCQIAIQAQKASCPSLNNMEKDTRNMQN